MDKDRTSKSKSLDEQIKEAELRRIQSQSAKFDAEKAEIENRDNLINRWGNQVFKIVGAFVAGGLALAWLMSVVTPLTQMNNELASAKLERAGKKLAQALLESADADSLLSLSRDREEELDSRVGMMTARLDSTIRINESKLIELEATLKKETTRANANLTVMRELRAQIASTKTDIAEGEADKQEIKRIATSPYLSKEAVAKMLKDKGYFCREGLDWSNPAGTGLENKFEVRGKVAYDAATGLTWQQSGSPPMVFANAEMYIKRLNAEKLGGFSDWRFPTLEEAMSLMEPKKSKNEMYINPVFDKTQQRIWTSDKRSASDAWWVNFSIGYCDRNFVLKYYPIRAVR